MTKNRFNLTPARERALMASLLFASGLFFATSASAQIDRPGSHVKYSAELEPHLVLQHADEPPFGDEGIGLGLRASLPLIQDGPVKTINNNLALTFGLDWAHFDGDCGAFFEDACDANDFWIPIAVQWNFFFSDLISAFPELGLGLQYSSWEGDWDARCVTLGGGRFCGDDDDGDLDFELVLWLGVRFHVSRDVAITLRLGTPSILIGASFFL